MAEKIFMKGCEAVAETAVRAGCRFFAGYPITPQNDVPEYFARRMPQVGGVFIQGESEVASINMVYGAAATGVRAMTGSSSPGISLKSEGLSYLAGADLPALVVNVQRGGPGLGGIQPSQSDYFQATRAPGHGDFHMIVLAPASVQEMAELTVKGFDLADKYRMTCMILADGTVGQMMEPVELPAHTNAEPDRSWAVTGTRMNRPHHIVNSLYLSPEKLEEMNFARYARYDTIREKEPLWEEFHMEDAEICLVAFGIAARVAKAAIQQARSEGVRAGLIRPITLWPFPEKALMRAAEQCLAFLSVELNMGQMIDDIRLATDCRRPVSLLRHTGGVIPTPAEVLEKIRQIAGGAQT